MDKVYELVKDRPVIYSVDINSTVLDAARFMMEHNIGAVPVLREGELAGTTKVSEVMTANPRAVSVDESIENCLFMMKEFGFRHIPITEGKKLKGLVSLRDIMLRKREPVSA
jgi:CBS domain-containing protein